MVDRDLRSRILDYEDSLRVCAKWCAENNSVARALCEIYARRSATLLFSFVSGFCPTEINTVHEAVHGEYTPAFKSVLPSTEDVRSHQIELFDAVASKDWDRVMKVLQQMGVPRLCVPLERQLDRLEFVVGCVIGRARLVPLVELAMFVAAQGDYRRVNKYVEEAYRLNPGATELHDLLTICGLAALVANDVTSAKKQLLESVRVFITDSSACMPNRLRGFNVSLAQKLMEKGEYSAVINYLAQCQLIWSHQGTQIDTWIDAIRADEQPDLTNSGFLVAVNRPGIRIQFLTLRASMLGNGDESLQMGRDDSMMDTREHIEEYRRQWRKAIKGKLDIGNN